MEQKKVDSKLVLITLVLVLIALLLLNYFLKNNNTDEIWNYENIDGVSNILYQGTITKDREIYYNLEKIVEEYLNSYVENYNIDETQTMKYTDYYRYLTTDYKNYLNKSEYEEVAKSFLNKFYIETSSEIESRKFMDTERILKSVYKFDNDVYLCELKSSYKEDIGYIAIQLQTEKHMFHIVYIE